MKTGEPPTALKARTGEFTPPTRERQARSKSPRDGEGFTPSLGQFYTTGIKAAALRAYHGGMEHLGDIARYLDSAAYRLKGQGGPRPAFGHAPFVTITRQAGAGGRILADAVLERLNRRSGPAYEGWQVFDRSILHMLAEDPKLKVSMRHLLNEEYHNRLTDYVEEALFGWTPQDVLMAKIFRAARALCGAGKIIIVGRGSQCATADLPGGIHVRLVASKERRLRKLKREWGIDEKRALKRMEELDEARKMLVRVHFRRDADDPLLYDAVFNGDRLPYSEIADWIVEEIEKKAHLLEAAAGRTRSAGSA
jgi:hypothetical protein